MVVGDGGVAVFGKDWKGKLMKKDYKKFDYWTTQLLKDGVTYFSWYMRCKETNEGVHFHGKQCDEVKDMASYRRDNRHRFSTLGLEIHRTKPIYEGQLPMPRCIVTGGECYGDGTSLYASERLGHVDPSGPNDNEIWFVLHDFYRSHFEERGDDNDPTT